VGFERRIYSGKAGDELGRESARGCPSSSDVPRNGKPGDGGMARSCPFHHCSRAVAHSSGRDTKTRRAGFEPATAGLEIRGANVEPIDNQTVVSDGAPVCRPVCSSDTENRTSGSAEGGENPSGGVEGNPADAAAALAEALAMIARLPGLTDAERAGLSWGTVKRAKTALGIRADRYGFGRAGQWLWSLPTAIRDHNENLRSYGKPAPLCDFDPENADSAEPGAAHSTIGDIGAQVPGGETLWPSERSRERWYEL